MAVNKVIYGGEPLVDLTGDSVSPDSLLTGRTAHQADGTTITGTMFEGMPESYSLSDALLDNDGDPIEDISGDEIDGDVLYARYSSALIGPPGPKGDKGDPGPKGDKGDDGAKGAKGDPGVTPNIQIGTVSTLDAGSKATASITGTTTNPKLNLGIPKGEKGDAGESASGGSGGGWKCIYDELGSGRDVMPMGDRTMWGPYISRSDMGSEMVFDLRANNTDYGGWGMTIELIAAGADSSTSQTQFKRLQNVTLPCTNGDGKSVVKIYADATSGRIDIATSDGGTTETVETKYGFVDGDPTNNEPRIMLGLVSIEGVSTFDTSARLRIYTR